MDKPTGYIVRPKDMKALVRKLNRPQTSLSELYEVARTLIGWAEPQQTQLPPVSVASLALPLSWETRECGHIVTVGASHVCAGLTARWDEPVNVPADPDVEPQPYDMPSPEADALDRIADLIHEPDAKATPLSQVAAVAAILRETGRVV